MYTVCYDFHRLMEKGTDSVLNRSDILNFFFHFLIKLIWFIIENLSYGSVIKKKPLKSHLFSKFKRIHLERASHDHIYTEQKEFNVVASCHE